MRVPEGRRLAPWVVVLAGVSAALHVGKLPPAVLALQQDMGVTLVQAGFLLSLVQIGAMLLGLVAGLLADGVGLRRCMLVGLGLLTVAGGGGAWAQDASSLMWLRAAEGAGVLLTVVPAPSLIRRTVSSARSTRMLGVWGGFMPFGMGLALLAGPLVIDRVGWRSWWLLIAACSGAMLCWVAMSIPADGHASKAAPSGEPWRWRLVVTLRAPGPWLAALTFCVYAAQWLAVIGFLPTIYQQAGWGGALGAVLTATVASVNVIGNVVAGRLLHRQASPRALLWIGFAAMAIGTWLAFGTVTAHAPVLRFGGALLFSTVGGLIPGTLFALAPRLAPSENTIATTVGWVQQWSSVGQMAGPPLVALLVSRVGTWDLTWAVTGTCCVIGVLLATPLQQRGLKPAA